MRVLPLGALAFACAACAGNDAARLQRLTDEIAALRRKTLELDQALHQSDEQAKKDREEAAREVNEVREELDYVRAEARAIRQTAGPGGGPVAEIQHEETVRRVIEALRRAPGREEAVAETVAALKPVSAVAVPFLVLELRDAIKRADLPLMGALERVLAGMDPETAVPPLVAELDAPATRLLAAGILGALGHTSAREPLAKRLAAAGEKDFDFRFACAEALVKLKGPEGHAAIPVLIEALDPKYRRDLNIQAHSVLKQITGYTFDYRPFGTEERKLEGLKAWREWWDLHGDTFEFNE